MESPTYEPLRSAIESFGATSSLLSDPRRKWEVPERLFWRVVVQPKLVVLTSPNPSGRAESCDQLGSFRNGRRRASHVLVDTVYVDYFDWDPVLLGSAIASDS